MQAFFVDHTSEKRKLTLIGARTPRARPLLAKRYSTCLVARFPPGAFSCQAEGIACLGDVARRQLLRMLRMCAADPLERSPCAPATMPAAAAWWHNVLLRRFPSHWLL